MEDWILRPDRPEDGPVIRRMIREARLNPFGLHIPRFWVAEVQGQVVGAVQIRPHRDGSRELASLVVDPAWRAGASAAPWSGRNWPRSGSPWC
jgi:N-acetylglutamate synthase-like GNAT family acetyltransferase